MEAAPKRARHCVTHRDRAICRQPDHDQLGRQREGHRVTRHDERQRQPAAQPQPRERAAVSRGVAVHDVHLLARDRLAERVGERAQAMEVERHHLEPGVPGQLREHRPGAAADEHPVPAARELAADVGYYRRRARSAALVRELKDGERPVRHGTKLVILSGACTSSSPPTSQCRRRATAARNASCWRWCEGSRRSGTA